MRSRPCRIAGFLVGVLLTVAVVAVAAASEKPKVAIFGTAEEVEIKPRTIFLSADAGPALIHLKWKGWGTPRATATGTYVSDCASCAPPKRRPAKVVLRKLGHCRRSWGNYDTYLHGTIRTIPDFAKNRSRRTTYRLDIGLGFCTKYEKG